MVKKTEVTKEYLEEKIKTLQEQQQKVITVLNNHSKLFDKIEGAIEITSQMLKDLESEDEVKPEKSTKSVSK